MIGDQPTAFSELPVTQTHVSRRQQQFAMSAASCWLHHIHSTIDPVGHPYHVISHRRPLCRGGRPRAPSARVELGELFIGRDSRIVDGEWRGGLPLRGAGKERFVDLLTGLLISWR